MGLIVVGARVIVDGAFVDGLIVGGTDCRAGWFDG